MRGSSNQSEHHFPNGIEIAGVVTKLSESSDSIIIFPVCLRRHWAIETIQNGNFDGEIAWGDSLFMCTERGSDVNQILDCVCNAIKNVLNIFMELYGKIKLDGGCR